MSTYMMMEDMLEQGLVASYRARGEGELPVEEEFHNANMARYRIAVEWGFGRIASLFALTDYKELKLGLSPIGDWYFAGGGGERQWKRFFLRQPYCTLILR